MNYQKHYNLLIQKAQNRIFEGYSESHHIVPRCIGGSNKRENLVRLTPEEHYLAHQLLVKIYPKNKGLIYAAHLMGNLHNNKEYGWLKCQHAKILTETRSGKNHPQYGKPGTMLGKKHDETARCKMRHPRSETAKQNMKKPVGAASPYFGRKHTEESKQKMRKPKPRKSGYKSSMYGKNHSIISKLKMRDKALNRKKEQCPQCGVIMMVSHIKKYHLDKCKYSRRVL